MKSLSIFILLVALAFLTNCKGEEIGDSSDLSGESTSNSASNASESSVELDDVDAALTTAGKMRLAADSTLDNKLQESLAGYPVDDLFMEIWEDRSMHIPMQFKILEGEEEVLRGWSNVTGRSAEGTLVSFEVRDERYDSAPHYNYTIDGNTIRLTFNEEAAHGSSGTPAAGGSSGGSTGRDSSGESRYCYGCDSSKPDDYGWGTDYRSRDRNRDRSRTRER